MDHPSLKCTVEPLIKATPDMTTCLSPKCTLLVYPGISPPLYKRTKFHSPVVATIEGFHCITNSGYNNSEHLEPRTVSIERQSGPLSCALY